MNVRRQYDIAGSLKCRIYILLFGEKKKNEERKKERNAETESIRIDDHVNTK